MPLVSTVWRVRIPVAFGLLAGLIHALTEMALLRAVGYGALWGDLAAMAVVGGLLGAAGLGMAGGLTLLLHPGARRSDAVLARWMLFFAGAGYLLMARRIDLQRDGPSGLAMWTLPGLIALVALLAWLWSRPRAFGALPAALVALSAVFCSLGLAGEELSRVQPDRQWLFLATLGGFALAATVLSLGWAMLGKGRGALVPPALMAAALAALAAAGPQFYGWRATLRPPVLGAQADGPNLILIVLDTVRADHLDLFGYERETMPLLAKRVRSQFDLVRQIHSTSSWTLPSHGSLFTGLYPWAHGAHLARAILGERKQYTQSLRADVPTMAETMAAAGYATAGVASNYGVMSGYGMDRGFSYFHATPGPGYLAYDLLWVFRACRNRYYKLNYWLFANLPDWASRSTAAFNRFRPWQRRADEIRVEASRWLDDNPRRPFFLFLNFMDAHSLYLPVEQDDEYFVKRPAGAGGDSFRRDVDALKTEGRAPRPDYLEFYVGQYDAEMRQLDRALESFFADLEQRGLYDDSLIVVTSDHGEEFMEHGMLEHGDALYETLIRVPLLVKLPASAKAPIDDGPALQHVDLLPTVAEILGFEAPPGLHGTVWGRGRKHALAEAYRVNGATGLADLAAVIIDDQKLLISTADPMLAYDLAADPGELHPIIPPPPELKRAGVAVTAGRKFDVAGELPADADPELLDRLKSLGYIQ